jgi:hypothetical protein
MSTRHHGTGQFAARGPRQPRTEHAPVARPAKPSKANAAFNADMARSNKAGAKATAGQLIAAGAIKGS